MQQPYLEYIDSLKDTFNTQSKLDSGFFSFTPPSGSIKLYDYFIKIGYCQDAFYDNVTSKTNVNSVNLLKNLITEWQEYNNYENVLKVVYEKVESAALKEVAIANTNPATLPASIVDDILEFWFLIKDEDFKRVITLFDSSKTETEMISSMNSISEFFKNNKFVNIIHDAWSLKTLYDLKLENGQYKLYKKNDYDQIIIKPNRAAQLKYFKYLDISEAIKDNFSGAGLISGMIWAIKNLGNNYSPLAIFSSMIPPMGGKKLTRTAARVQLGGRNAVVYQGPRGGKYVKVGGSYVALSKAVKSAQEGGKKKGKKPAKKC